MVIPLCVDICFHLFGIVSVVTYLFCDLAKHSGIFQLSFYFLMYSSIPLHSYNILCIISICNVLGASFLVQEMAYPFAPCTLGKTIFSAYLIEFFININLNNLVDIDVQGFYIVRDFLFTFSILSITANGVQYIFGLSIFSF